MEEQRHRDLRRALGSFLTGVTVVTAFDRDGNPRGITANSFTSVSLDPPLVLVCVDRDAASYETFTDCEGFAVHILSADQQETSATFAGKSPEKFAGLDLRIGRGGAPLLPASAALLDCRTERQLPVGDHVLLIGQVLDFVVHEHRPLGYHQGRYVSLAPELVLDAAPTAPQPDHAAGGLAAAWLTETADSAIVLCRTGDGWTVPHAELEHGQLDDAALAQIATGSLGVPTEVAFLYAMYDRTDTKSLLLTYRMRTQASAAEVQAARPALTCFAPEELPWAKIADPAIRSMVQRYVRERDGAAFGLYAGTAENGRIATLAAVAPG